MFAFVGGIGAAFEQAPPLQQLNLATDTGFGLTQAKGNVLLLGSGIFGQGAENFELRITNAELFLQNLIGFTSKDGSQLLDESVNMLTKIFHSVYAYNFTLHRTLNLSSVRGIVTIQPVPVVKRQSLGPQIWIDAGFGQQHFGFRLRDMQSPAQAAAKFFAAFAKASFY